MDASLSTEDVPVRTWQSIKPGLLQKGGIYVLSSGVSQALVLLTWIMLPWWLSAEAIGQFALISFGVDLVSRLILMGTDSAILRFYVEKERRQDILRASYRWLMIGSLVATGVLWMTRDLVPAIIQGLSATYSDLMWLMLAAAVATALATTVFSHYVAIGDAAQYGKLTVLRSALFGTGSLAAALLGLGVAGLIGAQIVAALIVAACFYRAGWAAAVHGRAAGGTMREVAGYGVPMTVYAAFSLLSDYSGRLLLDRQVTLSELGVFQFYYLIASQVNGVWTSLNRAWTPYMFQLLGSNRSRALRQMLDSIAVLTSLYAVGVVATMLVGAAGFWELILPAAFAGRADLLYVLLLGPLYCCIYTAIYPAYYYQKDTKRISAVQSLISVTAMLMTVVLTVKLKADGAALGWVLSIFIAPITYLICFPGLFRELKPVTAIVAIWGVGGALVALSLLRLHSTPFAIMILLGCAATVARRRWTSGEAGGKRRGALIRP